MHRSSTRDEIVVVVDALALQRETRYGHRMPVCWSKWEVSTYVSGLCLISRRPKGEARVSPFDATQRRRPTSLLNSTPYIDSAALHRLRPTRRSLPTQWRTTLLAWSSKPILRPLVILNINARATVTLLPPPRTIRSCWILFSTMKTKEIRRTLPLPGLTLCRSRRAIYTCPARLRLWPVLPRRLFRPPAPASHKAGPLIKTTPLLNHHDPLLANPRRLRVEDGGGHGRKSRS